MSITINGTGSITGLTAGGLPDGSVVAADIASGVIPAALSNAEDGTGTDFEFNSGYGSVATAYGCRAWVNFNGTGTVAIRAGGNVSSITDNGVADYTVNFTTAMPDANYAISGVAGLNTTSLKCVVQPYNLSVPTTGSVRIQAPAADGV